VDAIDRLEVAIAGSELRLMASMRERDPDVDLAIRFQTALGIEYSGPAPAAAVSAWHNVSRLNMDFYEVTESLECLSAIPIYLRSFPYRKLGISRSGYLQYHTENWLHETYILEKRFESCFTRLKRDYRHDQLSGEVARAVDAGISLIRTSLRSAKAVRSDHVHKSRAVDRDILILRSEELRGAHTAEQSNEVEPMFRRVRRLKAKELDELSRQIRSVVDQALAPLCEVIVVWDLPNPHLRLPAPV
jgi:hypothetical protein